MRTTETTTESWVISLSQPTEEVLLPLAAWLQKCWDVWTLLVLDGLDLTDDRVRLFVTDRDENGHIIMNRIQVSEELVGTGQSLSRLWINGYLGGVPELI